MPASTYPWAIRETSHNQNPNNHSPMVPTIIGHTHDVLYFTAIWHHTWIIHTLPTNRRKVQMIQCHVSYTNSDRTYSQIQPIVIPQLCLLTVMRYVCVCCLCLFKQKCNYRLPIHCNKKSLICSKMHVISGLWQKYSKPLMWGLKRRQNHNRREKGLPTLNMVVKPDTTNTQTQLRGPFFAFFSKMFRSLIKLGLD